MGTFFSPKPHYPPPNNQNGRLRQLQLHLLELLLRSGLLHLQQISSSSHRPVGTITRQHHNGAASPRRSSSSSFLKRENMWMDFFDECREAEWTCRSGIGGGRLTKIRDKKFER